MDIVFEELDFQQTPLGDISLRKRSEPRLNNEIIYEVKLGDEFLMSSLFVEAEEQLSTLGLAALKANGFNDDLNVVVGGLGLGYTALTALNDHAVRSLRVIDVMQPVISWHQQGLLPIGDVLAMESRCKLILGDFFALATDPATGFINNDQVHAVLLDIDHSPSHWLNQGNSSFYSQQSLAAMATKIVSGGIFGLWSNELPDQQFIDVLNTVFRDTQSHVVCHETPCLTHQ